MQAADVEAEAISKPPATRLWMWLVWLALSALAWGAIASIVLFLPVWRLGHVPVSEDYIWIWRLRFEVMPVAVIVALAAPVIAGIALVVRRWRPAALWVVGLAACLQLAYFGFEAYLQAKPLPASPLLEESGWPALDTR